MLEYRLCMVFWVSELEIRGWKKHNKYIEVLCTRQIFLMSASLILVINEQEPVFPVAKEGVSYLHITHKILGTLMFNKKFSMNGGSTYSIHRELLINGSHSMNGGEGHSWHSCWMPMKGLNPGPHEDYQRREAEDERFRLGQQAQVQETLFINCKHICADFFSILIKL